MPRRTMTEEFPALVIIIRTITSLILQDQMPCLPLQWKLKQFLRFLQIQCPFRMILSPDDDAEKNLKNQKKSCAYSLLLVKFSHFQIRLFYVTKKCFAQVKTVNGKRRERGDHKFNFFIVFAVSCLAIVSH